MPFSRILNLCKDKQQAEMGGNPQHPSTSETTQPAITFVRLPVISVLNEFLSRPKIRHATTLNQNPETHLKFVIFSSKGAYQVKKKCKIHKIPFRVIITTTT